jgi:RNA polymerase sigma-70 factor (ECF subfamily)
MERLGGATGPGGGSTPPAVVAPTTSAADGADGTALDLRAVDRVRYLIDCAAEGDDAAGRELILLVQPAVYRVCTALGSGDDVEDLVQDTFLRAFRSMGNYRGDGNGFLPWILTIARNACATEVGRRTRRRALLDRLHAVGADPPDVLSEQATVESLVRCLPVEQREAFVLTQLASLTYAEAAVVCDCPVGTIRSRVARARDTLMARLQKERGECG